MALEIFHNPLVRASVRNDYMDNVTVSTEPTLRGRKELDVNSYYYCVKRIEKRPIKEFNDEIWMMMLH
jgi:hypothetical protein